jgi:hypothetical protein
MDGWSVCSALIKQWSPHVYRSEKNSIAVPQEEPSYDVTMLMSAALLSSSSKAAQAL